MSALSSGGEGFHDHRRTLTAADAGGAEAEALFGAAQCVKQMDRDARAGRGERVTDGDGAAVHVRLDRKSTRLNSSHGSISYAVFCLKKKKKTNKRER